MGELPEALIVTKAIISFIGSLGARNPDKIFNERIGRASSPGKEGELLIIGKDVFLSKNMSEALEKEISLEKAVYHGVKRGSMRENEFIPGPNFLSDMVPFADELNYVVVNENAEWLFLCGRDIFKEGIVKKSLTNGNALVLNERKECIGYGKIKSDRSQIIKNIFDLGDFLRRERKQ
jgi:ribosome biogenesis protein Nip4